MFKFLFLFFLSGWMPTTGSITNADLVCGKWLSAEKNLIVHVFKEGTDYKAKVVWFNSKDKSKAIDEFTDERNPDPALRNRKLLGMSILEGMDYVPETKTWENGKIYDAKNGRHWSASAYVDKGGMLRVTGYWQFKFIGRTISFTRI